jgi:hypothetical protein
LTPIHRRILSMTAGKYTNGMCAMKTRCMNTCNAIDALVGPSRYPCTLILLMSDPSPFETLSYSTLSPLVTCESFARVSHSRSSYICISQAGRSLRRNHHDPPHLMTGNRYKGRFCIVAAIPHTSHHHAFAPMDCTTTPAIQQCSIR